MSVFTPVNTAQLSVWLSTYDLGVLQHFSGIADGVQNSNFFVNTDRHALVLTLFERVPPDYLDFYLALMTHLAAADIPCPLPLPDRQQRTLNPLNGRPAAVFTRLYGQSPQTPTPVQCAALGNMLARLHRAAQAWPQFTRALPHPCGLAWLKAQVDAVSPHLAEHERQLLQHQFAEQSAPSSPHAALPQSIIHADLFRDNVLFTDERITGVLDFYFAGAGECLLDLAIAANDWCVDEAGAFDRPRLEAMLTAYHQQRPLNRAEQLAWPHRLRAAALRFWVSRLVDACYPEDGENVSKRDPAVYQRILQQRIQTPAPWLP